MVTRVSFASNNGHVNLTKRSCKINRKRKFVAESTTLLCSHLHSKAYSILGRNSLSFAITFADEATKLAIIITFPQFWCIGYRYSCVIASPSRKLTFRFVSLYSLQVTNFIDIIVTVSDLGYTSNEHSKCFARHTPRVR